MREDWQVRIYGQWSRDPYPPICTRIFTERGKFSVKRIYMKRFFFDPTY